MELARGANAELPDGPVRLAVTGTGAAPLDIAVLLLTAERRVRGDADLVFWNNPVSADGAVVVASDGSVAIDPSKVAPDTAVVALIAAVDPESPVRTLADVPQLGVDVTAPGAHFTCRADASGNGETATVLVEVYRRGEAWKVRAVGQGYATGMAGLATDFGIEIEAEQSTGSATAAPPTAVPPAAAPPPAAVPDTAPVPAPAPAPVVSLAKDAKVAVKVTDTATVITVTLQWDGGSATRIAQGADLDLYALYVPRSEAVPRTPQRVPTRGAVYYRHAGTYGAPPFIQLGGDVRVPGTERLVIARPDQQGYVLVCAYSAVANGIGDFKSYAAKAVIEDGRGAQVTVPLLEANTTSYWVAIALLDFTGPDGVEIRHVEKYSAGGENRPMLYADGRFAMDMGPVEFKGDDRTDAEIREQIALYEAPIEDGTADPAFDDPFFTDSAFDDAQFDDAALHAPPVVDPLADEIAWLRELLAHRAVPGYTKWDFEWAEFLDPAFHADIAEGRGLYP
ncbi:TerD domain-containing protein [Streptomycetaceae bacterium NBC_01309]